MNSISSLLKQNPQLVDLNLSSNFCGNDGVKVLATALKDPDSTLEVLILDENEIDNTGLAYLADALKNNTALQELSLRQNNIGGEGQKLRCLAGALADNTTLKKLQLDDNQIYSDAAIVLSESLALNTALQELELSDNEIGLDGAEAIQRLLVNKQGLSIATNNNPVNREVYVIEIPYDDQFPNSPLL